MSETPHPSFFALDAFAVSTTRDPAIDAHVASCAQCAGHLDTLRQPEPIPLWVPKLEPRRNRAPFALIAGALACAAAIALVVLGRDPADETTTLRGGPSVGIYIQREGHVFLWDGAQSVRAGDAIRLKVAPDGAAHVAVYSRAGSDLRPLVSMPIARNGETLLPRAWRVDGSGGAEEIVVAFSDGELALERVEAAVERGDPPEGTFIRSYVLPKAE